MPSHAERKLFPAVGDSVLVRSRASRPGYYHIIIQRYGFRSEMTSPIYISPWRWVRSQERSPLHCGYLSLSALF
eukprot:5303330-Amphidinium_carterae.1